MTTEEAARRANEDEPGPATPIRVLVVEDEEPARATLRSLVESDPDLEWVGETWGASSPGEIRRHAPDLVLLDVQMPGMDGFQVLRQLDMPRLPVVIFVTAHDEYAVDAFEVRALDYLLKPFTDARFRQALDQAKELLRTSAATPRTGSPRSIPASPPAPGAGAAVESILRDRLVVREGGRSLVLPRGEIVWIEASGQYVVVHLHGGREYLVRVALAELEDALTPEGFHRIHRSALVNLDAVREIRPRAHGDALVVLADGTEVRLARARRPDFEALLLGPDGTV